MSDGKPSPEKAPTDPKRPTGPGPRMSRNVVSWLMLVGLAMLLVGLLSDSLAGVYGTDSLRISLAIIQIAGLWGALHFWLAGTKCVVKPTM